MALYIFRIIIIIIIYYYYVVEKVSV